MKRNDAVHKYEDSVDTANFLPLIAEEHSSGGVEGGALGRGRGGGESMAELARGGEGRYYKIKEEYSAGGVGGE